MDNYILIPIIIGLSCFIAIIFMRAMMLFNKPTTDKLSPSQEFSDYVNDQYDTAKQDLHQQMDIALKESSDVPDFDEAVMDYLEILELEEKNTISKGDNI
jgi:hypothetical protein